MRSPACWSTSRGNIQSLKFIVEDRTIRDMVRKISLGYYGKSFWILIWARAFPDGIGSSMRVASILEDVGASMGLIQLTEHSIARTEVFSARFFNVPRILFHHLPIDPYLHFFSDKTRSWSLQKPFAVRNRLEKGYAIVLASHGPSPNVSACIHA